VGLFYGSLYFALQTGIDPDDYNNRLSLFFFSLMFVIIGHQAVIPEMQIDRVIFYRERGSHAYGSLSYWISSTYLELLIVFVNVFTYSLVLYYMAGLRTTSGAFGFFVYILYISSLTGLLVCQAVSAVSPSTQAAIGLFPVSLFFTVSFAGFIVYLPKFPVWLGSWAPVISFMRFGFQALTLNEFDNNDELPYEATYVDNLGFNTLSKDECAAYLLIFLVIFGILAYLPLHYLNFERR
jgi:ABC-type multidrug transport system permease subunit